MTDPDTSTAAPEPEADQRTDHAISCIDPLHQGDVPPGIEATTFSKLLEYIGTSPAHFHVAWERVEGVDGTPLPGWHSHLVLHMGSVCMGTTPDLSALDDPAIDQVEMWEFQRPGQASELRELGEALVGVAALIFATVDRLHPSVAYRTQVRKGPAAEDDTPPVDGQHDLPDDYPAPPADVAPGLLEGLRRLGDEYGPRGVAIQASRLALGLEEQAADE